MTSQEKVVLSLNHKEPDKIPIDFGGGGQTGMHVSLVAKLRDYYGLEKRLVKVWECYQMLGLFDEDLKQAIGVDVDLIAGRNTLFGFPAEDWKIFKMDDGLEVLVPGKFNTSKDEQGNTYIYPEGDMTVPPSGKMPHNGYFFDNIVRQEPIDDDNLNSADNLEEFTTVSDLDLQYLSQQLGELESTGRAKFGSIPGTALGDIALVSAPFLKHPKGIRDIEEWYISVTMRQDYLHQVFARQTEIAIENMKRIYQAVGNRLDVVFICGTDFGTQSSTFCSPNTFNELYKPYYKQINQWIHRNTTWKTFKHSCGAVESFIDLFIDAGFDILNPVQCSAAGMEPQKLKNKYGDRIVFWGGGVDTQKTLAFGTPEMVRREVLERCEIFHKNGGFVYNSIHNVVARTPVENVIAMIDAVHEFNGN
ncbi:MAG TPA: methyltransferase [Firmicutes bacterium]|nr:methyltransferase [Bacillota bacterium]